MESTAFDSVKVDEPKSVCVIGQYMEDDYFYIETETGNAKVDRIEFLVSSKQKRPQFRLFVRWSIGAQIPARSFRSSPHSHLNPSQE